MPVLTNLRLDPFERLDYPQGTLTGSQEYFSWFQYEFWRFVFVQQEVGKLAMSALEYPPMQRGASFNLDALKAELAKKMAEAAKGEHWWHGRRAPVKGARLQLVEFLLPNFGDSEKDQ